MHTLEPGSIGPICDTAQGALEAAYAAQRERSREAQHLARFAQHDHIAADRRQKALDAALVTSHAKHGHEAVLAAARSYEAYLKGE